MRRSFLAGLACAALATLVGCQSKSDAPAPATSQEISSKKSRIVSLSPALTETLFAIGAGGDVVGVSNYCSEPASVKKLPKTGTSITPSYEAIALLAPTLIVTEEAVNTRNTELERLAKVLALPWLTVGQISASVRQLGKLTHHQAQADKLAARFRTELKVQPPTGGPRVLLVLGYRPGPLSEIWYIRKNSLHGAALHAAGATNAIDMPMAGQPRLSLEGLIALDPEYVIVLSEGADSERVALEAWGALETLKAVQKKRVGVLQAPEAFANGPRIFGLVSKLRAELQRLQASSS